MFSKASPLAIAAVEDTYGIQDRYALRLLPELLRHAAGIRPCNWLSHGVLKRIGCVRDIRTSDIEFGLKSTLEPVREIGAVGRKVVYSDGQKPGKRSTYERSRTMPQ